MFFRERSPSVRKATQSAAPGCIASPIHDVMKDLRHQRRGA